ncbi:hypothetical protein TNIN_58631 [Trichonephila inaurata madagascariensis]|uniref:DUF4219 domain-containing protein n=1 Tax=Trichonephila inaurata madagascariensis TaxID=2747483 RepID=A0A8X7C236_9ARAC|nr:hypothetical protein TNIN_58631 [Trichonephila inaurata madagascariensis]
MDGTNYQIKQLDTSNYATWSTVFRFLSQEKNCFEIVAGNEHAPEKKQENQRELKDFNTRRCLALSILYLNISTEYRRGNVAMEMLQRHLVHLIDDPENKERPKLRRHVAVPSPIGSSVSSSLIMPFKVVDRTETVHLKTEMI